MQSNLKNEKLDKLHEFEIIYSGPSFESGIKIDEFIENLKSIKELIYAISDINSEHKKGYNKGSDIIEIKVTPSKGSIIEKIATLFSNPEIRSALVTIITALFFYLLSKKDIKKNEKEMNERVNEIEELIVRNQLKNAKKLYEPLNQKGDKLEIIEDKSIKLEIDFIQKDKINQSIHEIEREIEIEDIDEEHEGYISAIDVDKKRLRFHPKGMGESYPLEFNSPLNIITSLIGKPISAKMRVRKYKEKIRKFQLQSYKILQKSLDDFIKWKP